MKSSVKVKFLLIQLFVVGYIYANITYPLLTQKILDQLSADNADPIKGLFIRMLLVLILLIICCRGNELLKRSYLNQIKQYYREKVIGHLFFANSENLSSEKEAEYLSVFNNDIPMVCSDYYETILQIIYSVIAILFSISALANINGLIACVVILNFVGLATVPLVFKKQLQKHRLEISETLKRFNVKLKDSIFCLPVIKSYVAEKEILEKVYLSGRQANDADYKYNKVQQNANLASMCIGYFNDFLVLILGVYLIVKGSITIGSLLAIIQISGLLANPITTISHNINTVHAVKPIKQKLAAMQVKADQTKQAESCPLSDVSQITLQNVTIEKNGARLLDDVNLTLERGKRYLIMGHNGSGKSTLLKVINRNIPATGGSVLVDGIPSDKISQEDFSRNILMDYQEPYLFTASIKDNITMYQPYSEQQLAQIGEILKISSLIQDQEETRVHHLSGGEKQRVALARILLRNPAFFLLDEAFSAVDVDGRKELEQYLLNQGYSLVSVSHTDSAELLCQYDEIIVLQHGKVIEQGNYRQLMENKQYFAGLYAV